MHATERLLTPPEAAEILAICERKLWDLTKSGAIKAVLIPPRSVRYDPADVRAYINRCKGSGSQHEQVAAYGTNL